MICVAVNAFVSIRWDSKGYFKPNFDRGGEPFAIPMPPPNVTGSLHMGHAMFVTLEVRLGSVLFFFFFVPSVSAIHILVSISLIYITFVEDGPLGGNLYDWEVLNEI